MDESPVTRALGILPSRIPFGPEEDAIIRTLFPCNLTREVAALIDRSAEAVTSRAGILGVRKTAAHLAGAKGHRFNKGHQGGVSTRFKPGNVPVNKGIRRGRGYAPGRMGETQFKRGARQGRAAEIYQPIGTERISVNGYLELKINDGLPMQARWRFVHLLVWEAVHGRVPKGHAVCFLPGKKTNVRDSITLDVLELLTRKELMLRNCIHARYPKDVVDLIQLKSALTRKTNNRIRKLVEENPAPSVHRGPHEKQDARRSQSLGCDARRAR